MDLTETRRELAVIDKALPNTGQKFLAQAMLAIRQYVRDGGMAGKPVGDWTVEGIIQDIKNAQV